MPKILLRLLFAAVLLLTVGWSTVHTPFITAEKSPWVAEPTNSGGNMIFTRGDQCRVSIQSGNQYHNGLLLQARAPLTWWSRSIQHQWIFGFFLYGDKHQVDITQKWGKDQTEDFGPDIFSQKCAPYLSELPQNTQTILHQYGFDTKK